MHRTLLFQAKLSSFTAEWRFRCNAFAIAIELWSGVGTAPEDSVSRKHGGTAASLETAAAGTHPEESSAFFCALIRRPSVAMTGTSAANEIRFFLRSSDLRNTNKRAKNGT